MDPAGQQTESCRRSDGKREGQLLFFLIVSVSYNARYAKLRGVKIALFRIFPPIRPSWLLRASILRFLPFLHVCNFYCYFVFCFFSSRIFVQEYFLTLFLHQHVLRTMLLFLRLYFLPHGCRMHVTVRAILADCVFSIDKASATRRHSIYDISR